MHPLVHLQSVQILLLRKCDEIYLHSVSNTSYNTFHFSFEYIIKGRGCFGLVQWSLYLVNYCMFLVYYGTFWHCLVVEFITEIKWFRKAQALIYLLHQEAAQVFKHKESHAQPAKVSDKCVKYVYTYCSHITSLKKEV